MHLDGARAVSQLSLDWALTATASGYLHHSGLRGMLPASAYRFAHKSREVK